jgi:branched-chain amino acid transport system permease protein
MVEFLQMMASGIAAGSTYALIGLSMLIIYKTSGIVNYAQGEMALLVVFLTFLLLELHGFPFWVAFPAALICAFLLGCFLQFAVLRRAKQPSTLCMVMITIGIEIILIGFVTWKFDAGPKTMPFPISPLASVTIAHTPVRTIELLTFVAALVLMAALFLLVRYSKLGLAMRATQQDPVAARLLGIRTNRILMITWGVSSLSGCVAGLLIASTALQPYMMWDPLLKGAGAAVLGGMTSLPGSVFGAYLIGVMESLFGGYVSAEFKSSVAFFIIVLVLCIRPGGLFARRRMKKV